MTKWLAAVCLVFAASSAQAQINPKSMTVSAVSDCIREAIATSYVQGDGDIVLFSCDGAKAKALYNFLGRKIRTEIVQDRNGKFENRPFGNSACYHRIEDENRKAADDFRCDLIMVVGDAIRD